MFPMILCTRTSWTAMCHFSYFTPDRCSAHLFLCPQVSPPSISFLSPPPPIFPEAVHHVSVSINVSHSSLVCGEAWGTDPHFSWLYERVAITNTVGTVSKDGTTLFVTKTPFCGHFTCMVSNKLGYSSATYTAGTCGRDNIFSTHKAALTRVSVILLFWFSSPQFNCFGAHVKLELILFAAAV